MSACAAGYPDHVDADAAVAFVDRVLGETERAEVERRIDACAGCRAAIAEAAREDDATVRERPASAVPRRAAPLRPGDAVGRYIVERPLGAGGMGVVSLARDPELRRAVVIKLVRPDTWDHDLEARLRREAQAMAQLSHPNVVQIFDIGRHGDRVFLAMEFIAGETLDTWLIERERTAGEIIAMFLQAGAGLVAAHRAGLLHRDFKPTNVLVDRNGVAKVTDFGLARALAAPHDPARGPQLSGVHAVLTQGGSVVGTPAYMAPEQAAGQPLDARTDQYALALALLDALVGQQPTRRTVQPTQPAAEIEAALAKTPERARRAIARALRLDPDERFPDLASFLRELAPVRIRRRWPIAVAAVAILALAGVTVWLAVRDREAATCVAEAPRVWQAARDGVRQKLAARPRAFAAWHADHVSAQLDAAVADIGARELDRCEGRTVDAACLGARTKQLAAVGTLSLDNPQLELRGITSCDAQPERLTIAAALRAELADANPATARSIAERARAIEDDLLRADAFDHAARRALAAGYFTEAADDHVASASAGERAGDDSLRARAALGLLEVARMRGDLAAARDTVRQLDGMLERHGADPRDVFVVALAATHAYTELGDVAAAFANLERARAAAKSESDILRVRTAAARALQVLRWDADAAHTEIAAALAAHPGAGPARTEALTFALDLALARGDLAAARTWAAGADPIRTARVRALGGDPTGALAALAQITPSDPTTRARVDIAAAEIHSLAGQHAEANARLKDLFKRITEPSLSTLDYDRVGLSAFERTNAWLLRCDTAFAMGINRDCWEPKWLDTMHAKAPLRARYELQQAREYKRSTNSLGRWPTTKALEILVAANAKPIVVAEIKLEVVRLDEQRKDRKQLALEARDVLAAAGRTAEVAELDALIAQLGGAPRPSGGDPWAPTAP